MFTSRELGQAGFGMWFSIPTEFKCCSIVLYLKLTKIVLRAFVTNH